LIRYADENQTLLAVNYLQRLIPSFAKVKQLISEKTLGEPLSIKYYVGEEFRWPTVSGFYFNYPVSGRGVLRDRGAHVMDHICWWLGCKPNLISSQNDSFGGSDALAFVRFKSGRCLGEVRLSWLVNTPCKFIIECEQGRIEGDVYDYQSLFIKQGAGQDRRIRMKSNEKTKGDIAYKIVTNFMNAIYKGEAPLVSGSDVMSSIEFIDECYAAAARMTMPWYEIVEVQNGQ
jgi:predicted dehydrogenase